MRWPERIILWTVIVLIVVWLWILTDWVTWLDQGQNVILDMMDQLRETLKKFTF